MAEKLKTQKEFEERTGKGRTFQWSARKEGKLGYYKINSTIRYSEKHIQDFLQQFEIPSQQLEIKNFEQGEGENESKSF